MSLILKIAAGVVLGVVVLAVGCSALIASGTDTESSATWQWVTTPDCSHGVAKRWQITVVSEDGCPNGHLRRTQTEPVLINRSSPRRAKYFAVPPGAPV